MTPKGTWNVQKSCFHMVQKENVLDRQQNRKLDEIREILLEKDSGRSIIDITGN